MYSILLLFIPLIPSGVSRITKAHTMHSCSLNHFPQLFYYCNITIIPYYGCWYFKYWIHTAFFMYMQWHMNLVTLMTSRCFTQNRQDFVCFLHSMAIANQMHVGAHVALYLLWTILNDFCAICINCIQGKSGWRLQ